MRITSFTLRLSGRSFISECQITPPLSMRNRPRKDTDSSINTPYERDMDLVISATSGNCTFPMPPFACGVFFHAWRHWFRRIP